MRIDFGDAAASTPPFPRRSRPSRTWAQVLAALMRLAQGKAELLRHAERPWASVTFSGTRHTVALRFPGAGGAAAGEGFIAALPDHEFDLPGQIVAEAAVRAVDQALLPEPETTVEIELLLIEDC